MTITQTIYGLATGALMLTAFADLANADTLDDIPTGLICSFTDVSITSNNAMIMALGAGMADELKIQIIEDPQANNFELSDEAIKTIFEDNTFTYVWIEDSKELMMKERSELEADGMFINDGDYMDILMKVKCE